MIKMVPKLIYIKINLLILDFYLLLFRQFLLMALVERFD